LLKVLIADDDVTPMEFVVWVLETVFDKSEEDAVRIMLRTHHEGSAECGVYPEARARKLMAEATAAAGEAGHPLQFSVAKAGPSSPN
jgi:ATP-dependent Clp protease adaptor protein ClpS